MQHISNMSASQSLLKKIITLSHGSGGKETNNLISNIIAPALSMKSLQMDDSAILSLDKSRIAFTTDSFVVKPYFFPGGDIGKLSVCGTVNDLSVQGAEPLAMSLAFIIEEGFLLDDFKLILHSIAETAYDVGINIVTGDTKVVGKGSCDGIYINTSGIGIVPGHISQDIYSIKPSDKIIVSGQVGVHGIAVMATRYDFEVGGSLVSDCAPLNKITGKLLKEFGNNIKWMRDPTRGGLSSALNELSQTTKFDMHIHEEAIPLQKSAIFLANMLGIDILESASEGIFIAIADKSIAEDAVNFVRSLTVNKHASIIGEVGNENKNPTVFLNTRIGGKTVIHMPTGEQLPRIC